MKKEEVINCWAKSSQEDMRTAADLFRTHHYQYCLFFCHLSIEKILKALIVKNTGRAPLPIHNLRRLVRDINIQLSDMDLALLDEINEFNIKARYNDFKFAFYKKATEDFTLKYLNKSKKLYLWLKKQL